MLIGASADPATISIDFEIHRHVFPFLQSDGKLLKRYVKAVMNAVRTSLEDPLTRPLFISQNAVKERLQICQQIAVEALNEHNFSVIHLCDALPAILRDVLTQAVRVDDTTAEQSGSVWAAPAETNNSDSEGPEVTFDPGDLNQE